MTYYNLIKRWKQNVASLPDKYNTLQKLKQNLERPQSVWQTLFDLQNWDNNCKEIYLYPELGISYSPEWEGIWVSITGFVQKNIKIANPINLNIKDVTFKNVEIIRDRKQNPMFLINLTTEPKESKVLFQGKINGNLIISSVLPSFQNLTYKNSKMFEPSKSFHLTLETPITETY